MSTCEGIMNPSDLPSDGIFSLLNTSYLMNTMNVFQPFAAVLRHPCGSYRNASAFLTSVELLTP